MTHKVAVVGSYTNFAGRKTYFILYHHEVSRLHEYLVLPDAKIIKEFKEEYQETR